MSKKTIHIKAVTISIIALFILASCSQIIGRHSEESYVMENDFTDVSNIQNDALVTCYTFGFLGEPICEVSIPIKQAELLLNKIEELQIEIAKDPLSERTQQLQDEIIGLANEYNLLPQGLSPEQLMSRLHPSWIPENNRLGSPSPLQNRASEWFCNFASTGSGSSLPVIIFPRLIPILLTPIPRVFLRWSAIEGTTSCGGLLSGKGFLAYGQQKGFALGFWGLGFSVFLPPLMGYGLIGYALYASVEAEEIEYWPPNNPPVVDAVYPPDEAENINISLSELSFQIEDADGDFMNYMVTTEPDIGSGSGDNVKDGVYSIPISGLKYDQQYRWTVRVDDGEDAMEEQYLFYTEVRPFDPFEAEWQYCKEVTINHNKVNGDLLYFPVLINIVDSDLRDKAQGDGDDIIFMDGPGVAYRLYHEIEYYDGSSGELISWINLPAVSNEQDTVFYMYYGNPDCGSQQFQEKSWNSHFRGVWHLHENPAGTIHDSTRNDNDGSSYGEMSSEDLVDGKVGQCVDFDGDNDYISIPDSSSLKPGDISLIAWFRPQEEYPQNGVFLTKACYDYWGNADGRTYTFYWRGLNDTIYGLFERDSQQQTENIGEYSIEINTWYHLVLTFDESTDTGIFYVNGVEDDSESSLHDSVLWYNRPWDFIMAACKMGEGGPTINTWFKCRLDEVRILDIPLSSDWISTEYNNQNDPSTFFSIGPEESGP